VGKQAGGEGKKLVIFILGQTNQEEKNHVFVTVPDGQACERGGDGAKPLIMGVAEPVRKARRGHLRN